MTTSTEFAPLEAYLSSDRFKMDLILAASMTQRFVVEFQPDGTLLWFTEETLRAAYDGQETWTPILTIPSLYAEPFNDVEAKAQEMRDQFMDYIDMAQSELQEGTGDWEEDYI